MKSITPRCCNSLDMNRLVTFYSRLSTVILNVCWLRSLCGVNTHRISASVFRKKMSEQLNIIMFFEKRRLELTGAVTRLLLVILDSDARIRRSSVVWPSGLLDRNSGLRLATKDRTIWIILTPTWLFSWLHLAPECFWAVPSTPELILVSWNSFFSFVGFYGM